MPLRIYNITSETLQTVSNLLFHTVVDIFSEFNPCVVWTHWRQLVSLKQLASRITSMYHQLTSQKQHGGGERETALAVKTKTTTAPD